ncbi:pilus assembly PilX N-terminal domain-containing protein [Thiohalorhabdus methylotrophus]|uniref:Pilus assembly PilX N-terminal domain-containing protein n=1 Tax=Thiohalorhabdus methylotrophus TaxID=3242694 RepID=A0ABV4TYA3_9GAMM
MSPDSRTHSESGVGLVAAVFVIVVLGLLGSALVRLTVTEQASVGREMASLQAFLAAETAVQWGLYHSLNPSGGPSSLPGGGLFAATPPGGLRGCGSSRVLPGTNPPERFGPLYRFRAEGLCYPGRTETTRRQVEVRFQEDG